MIRVNIEMPKGCNTCPFAVHYDSGGAHGFYCSLSNNPEHRWGEANDDGFKFADCPISVVEYNTQVLDKIKAEIEQVVAEESTEDLKWALGLKYAIKIIDKYKTEQR